MAQQLDARTVDRERQPVESARERQPIHHHRRHSASANRELVIGRHLVRSELVWFNRLGARVGVAAPAGEYHRIRAVTRREPRSRSIEVICRDSPQTSGSLTCAAEAPHD